MVHFNRELFQEIVEGMVTSTATSHLDVSGNIVFQEAVKLFEELDKYEGIREKTQLVSTYKPVQFRDAKRSTCTVCGHVMIREKTHDGIKFCSGCGRQIQQESLD